MNKFTFPIVLVVAAVVLGCAPMLYNAYTNELLLRTVMAQTERNVSFVPLAPIATLTCLSLGMVALLAGIILGWKAGTRPD
ncbi:hypothetical protein RugamoR64_47860 [Duganella rhizosphaerae]|uniref:hypothetical protein n=1 Tax=Duganella rhizosphaerae TaxID=2885763 RepID=UPI0030EA85EB